MYTYRVTIKEINRELPVHMSITTTEDIDYVRSFFGCEENDVEWYTIEKDDEDIKDASTQERAKWIDDAFDYHNNRIKASFDGAIHISDAEIERTRKSAPLYKRLAEIYEEHERRNLEFRRTLPPEAFQGYGGQTPQYDGPTELPWSEQELTEIRELEEKINRM